LRGGGSFIISFMSWYLPSPWEVNLCTCMPDRSPDLWIITYLATFPELTLSTFKTYSNPNILPLNNPSYLYEIFF